MALEVEVVVDECPSVHQVVGPRHLNLVIRSVTCFGRYKLAILCVVVVVVVVVGIVVGVVAVVAVAVVVAVVVALGIIRGID